MTQHVNIISFDVPFPPNYGGAIDVFYKIRWLHSAGIKVHLHCFVYGRKPSPELEALCEETFYYQRKTGFLANLSLLPYTVQSRRSRELKINLLRNGHPVLFEVLNTCFLLRDTDLGTRRKIFRHSNIEHAYYFELAKAERSFKRKIFHYVEAWKLKRFEKVVKHADTILAVNEKDAAYFMTKYRQVRTKYLPSFHANDSVTARTGKGAYVLVHGNLSVAENYQAVLWLLKNVFPKTRVPVVVAGLNPPAFLEKEIAALPHVDLRSNPSDEEMERLMHEAHIHLVYTGQPTGLKLKLLNVLFKGRFVLCNAFMLSGTGLSANNSLKLAEDAGEFVFQLSALLEMTFDEEMLRERKKQVERFDNARNLEILLNELF